MDNDNNSNGGKEDHKDEGVVEKMDTDEGSTEVKTGSSEKEVEEEEESSSESTVKEDRSEDSTSVIDDDEDYEDIPSLGSSNKDPTELVAEAVRVKDEGNDHFKSGDLIKASRSYRKGTSLLKNLNKANTGDEQVKALLVSLQTNLSMVCFKQNKHKQSRDVASKALEVDSENVKALFRRAVACRKLGDFDKAKDDLKFALQLDPTNKAVQKELLSLKKEADDKKKAEKAALAKAFSSKSSSFLYNDKEEEEKKKMEEKAAKEEEERKAKEKRKADWEDICVQRLSRGEEAISFEEYEKQLEEKRKEEEKARKKAKKEEEERKKADHRAANKVAMTETPDSDSDEELTEQEMKMFRGYKKTSDGRTTSYFTREQSEEEKRFLGDIAPQRLQADPQPLSPTPIDNSSSANSTSQSAWNQAGTWEEKDTSAWCNASLEKFLKGSKVEIDHCTAQVTDVKDLTGDASVAFTRGKKRYVFDYHASVKYEIMDEGDEKIASGTLKLPDISSTGINDELEVDILSWKKTPAENVNAIATKCRDGLVDKIRSQVLEFVTAFNNEY
jgi:tetratricopeptide (TPR) repeat protein